MLRTPLIDIFMPRRAVDFLLDQNLQGPLLHERALGSYLDYRFAQLPPNRAPKAAFDERLPLFSKELAIAERSLRSLQPGFEKAFELLGPVTVLCRKGSALYSYLKVSPAWSVAYEDEAVRDTGDELEAPKSAGKSSFAWVLFRRAI